MIPALESALDHIIANLTVIAEAPLFCTGGVAFRTITVRDAAGDELELSWQVGAGSLRNSVAKLYCMPVD